jgi:hypothetical protein
MKIFEDLNAVITYVQASLALLERARELQKRLSRLVTKNTDYAYKNDFIDEELEIQDRLGRRAVLRRTHGVHVLSTEAPVIRQLCWGDGEPLAHFRVEGARKLGLASEGMKKVVLLGLPRSTGQTVHVLKTRRLIRDEFTDRRGYFELQVERPTGRFSLKVIFPSRRPPRDVEVTSIPQAAAVPAVKRCRSDGRTALSWTLRDPVPFAQYSMRWSW